MSTSNTEPKTDIAGENHAIKKGDFYLLPTPGKIIVRPDEFAYAGKIVIPDKAKRVSTIGTILAIGEDVGKYEELYHGEDDVPVLTFIPRFHLGQRVLYGIYSGVPLKFKNDPAFIVLNMDEILCTVEGDHDFEGADSLPGTP